jgi:glycyl-tRNA synthetase
MAAPSRLDSVITLAQHRGFVFPSGEIYGGTRSAWDYGPLGVELKENIKREWWNAFVRGRGDMWDSTPPSSFRRPCGRRRVTSRCSATR